MAVVLNEKGIKALQELTATLDRTTRIIATGLAAGQRNPRHWALALRNCLDQVGYAKAYGTELTIEMLTGSSPPETTPDQPCGCRSSDEDDE